jgi:hypothetical protein
MSAVSSATRQSPRPGTKPTPIIDRLMRRVAEDMTTGCWIWTGSCNASGYGRIAGPQGNQFTHRVAYEYFVAEIPEGLHIDHLCRVTSCCNPWHLDPVTPAENLRRAGNYEAKVALEECPRGHSYTPENTRIHKRGYRACLTCERARYQRYQQRLQENAR